MSYAVDFFLHMPFQAATPLHAYSAWVRCRCLKKSETTRRWHLLLTNFWGSWTKCQNTAIGRWSLFTMETKLIARTWMHLDTSALRKKLPAVCHMSHVAVYHQRPLPLCTTLNEYISKYRYGNSIPISMPLIGAGEMWRTIFFLSILTCHLPQLMCSGS